MSRAGGIIRVVNGCADRPRHGARAAAAPSWLRALQVLEYLRSFLLGRIGWAALSALLIISGAFGLFRRDAVDRGRRLWTRHRRRGHGARRAPARHLREPARPYRVVFVPDPVCWTEVPGELAGAGAPAHPLARAAWASCCGSTAA